MIEDIWERYDYEKSSVTPIPNFRTTTDTAVIVDITNTPQNIKIPKIFVTQYEQSGVFLESNTIDTARKIVRFLENFKNISMSFENNYLFADFANLSKVCILPKPMDFNKIINNGILLYTNHRPKYDFIALKKKLTKHV